MKTIVYVVLANVACEEAGCWFATFDTAFLKEEEALRYALNKANDCNANEITYTVEKITLE